MLKEASTKKYFKKTWQTINKALKRGSKKLVSPTKLLTENGSMSSNNKIIVNILNKHFTSVGEKLAEKLTKSDTNPNLFLGDKNSKSFYMRDIEPHEILEEIQEICEKKYVKRKQWEMIIFRQKLSNGRLTFSCPSFLYFINV